MLKRPLDKEQIIKTPMLRSIPEQTELIVRSTPITQNCNFYLFDNWESQSLFSSIQILKCTTSEM